MTPLAIFLLACVAVYLGALDAAFSALMRLSLRLVAERSGRPGALNEYLDDPLVLFIPVRLLLGIVTGLATVLMARLVGVEAAHTLPSLIVAVAAFVVVCEMLLPLIIVGRDPGEFSRSAADVRADRPGAGADRPVAGAIGVEHAPRRAAGGPDGAAEESKEAARHPSTRRNRKA